MTRTPGKLWPSNQTEWDAYALKIQHAREADAAQQEKRSPTDSEAPLSPEEEEALF